MAKSNNTWKSKQIVGAFSAFTKQFGELDDHSRVVLEIILEELHGRRKGLPVFGTKKQTGSQSATEFPCKGEDSRDEDVGY